MTDSVFVFGSFTEDEVLDFQSPRFGSRQAQVGSLVISPIKENGCHRTIRQGTSTKAVAGSSPCCTNSGYISNGQKPDKVGTQHIYSSITSNGRVQRTAKTPSTTTPSTTRSAVSELHLIGANENGIHENKKSGLDAARIELLASRPACQNREQSDQNKETAADLRNEMLEVIFDGNPHVGVQSEKEKACREVAVEVASPAALDDIDDESTSVASELLPKSWAALVTVPINSNGQIHLSSNLKSKTKVKLPASHSLKHVQVAPVIELSGETWLKSLHTAGVLRRRLQPRGLTNMGNSCFLNSTLQAMLSCSSFLHLLQVLQDRKVPQTGYPTLQAFVEFVRQFEMVPDQNSMKVKRDGDGKASLDVGRPFAPSMFDSVLSSFSPGQPRIAGRNRQEDAQEFLSFLINQLHEEVLSLEGKKSANLEQISSVPANDDDDWETVGPKNRTAVTRTHTFCESAVSEIFGGQLRSVVKTKGNKASATIQPFLVLHLDIVPELVHSVEDALRFFAAPEFLEGYKPASAKASEVVSASKSIKIQTLPRVLVLHLMRFTYGAGGSGKLLKPVSFPLELILGRELLASPASSGIETRKYELVATVSHHGKDSTAGHYTADSKQPNGQWLRFDDSLVSWVTLNRVLFEQVYVLFYRRVSL